MEGFQAHTDNVAAFYRERRDVFQRLAEKHLAGLAEWTVPSAGRAREEHPLGRQAAHAAALRAGGACEAGALPGMFFWLKLLGTHDSMALIKEKAVERKVLMVPGQVGWVGGPGRCGCVAAAALTPDAAARLPARGGGGAVVQSFNPDDAPSPYVRASFSVVTDGDLDEALRRLAALVRGA